MATKTATVTKEQLEKYVKDGGNQCPKCGSLDVNGGSLTFEGGSINQRLTCSGCGTQWYDVYELRGAGVLGDDGEVETEFVLPS